MKQILIINGPNLNLLGKRETDIYGSLTFEDYLQKLEEHYRGKVAFEYFQSNIEGELIDTLQQSVGKYDGVIINAGGYTHTAVALADAIGAIIGMGMQVVEVHISNLLTRENFRHNSLIGPKCRGSIMGFGLESYRLAVEYFIETLQ